MPLDSHDYCDHGLCEKTAMSECFRAMKEMLSLRLQVHASAISDWNVKGCLI